MVRADLPTPEERRVRYGKDGKRGKRRATTADDDKLVLAKELRLGGNEPEKRKRRRMDAPWTLLCGGGRRARGYLGREYKGRR